MDSSSQPCLKQLWPHLGMLSVYGFYKNNALIVNLLIRIPVYKARHFKLMDMKYLFFAGLMIICFQVFSQESSYQVIKFPELEKELQARTKNIRVYNFWATWCRPCIQELPYFEALNSEYSDVDVILVSFDFPDQHDRVGAFIQKHGIESVVKILDETDFNAFIDKINAKWSGAIPATLIIDSEDQHHFYEKAFEKDELFETIDKLKQQKL